MEPLKLKMRQPVQEEAVENWDEDDDFMIDGDELTLRSASTTNTATSRRRDSTSSHISLRSDLESWGGEIEESVHVPGDDENSTLNAIKAAESAGIPLPKNVPSSALMGGTVKRLSGRKIQRALQEDWETDLELPDSSRGLTIKPKSGAEFPETLRKVSADSVQTSPTAPVTRVNVGYSQGSAVNAAATQTNSLAAALKLDQFKDDDDDDFWGGAGGETIKVSKIRNLQQPVSVVTPPTPQKQVDPADPDDDFEKDLELPSSGRLKLTNKKNIPITPSSNMDDLDWGEGSLGTRYGGTRREARSNRSSSVSALSPSLSSSLTIESEDETFDGLVLPEGPVNFQDRLQKRRSSRSPHRESTDMSEPPLKKVASADRDADDFMDGLELGDGEVFSSKKLSLHQNVKVKDRQPATSSRPKPSVSLTFTNRPVSTRIPRLSHERAHSTALEPVSESGDPIVPSNRRSLSRLGHANHTSISSIPSPSSPSSTSSTASSTPGRREVTSKSSLSSLREPTTTSSQLLKQKRSLPGIKSYESPPKSLSYRTDRPSSRGGMYRPPSSLRPKTPVERTRPSYAESPVGQRRGQLPFLPAGTSSSQSQHAATKTLRHFRRHDSDNAIDMRPISRTFSRTGGRSPSPQRFRVAADTWERLSKPKGKKQFGSGHELDGFDDLPTSREAETKYLKQPAASGAKNTLRGKPRPALNLDRVSTPTPSTVRSPSRGAFTPRFAQDTAASRIARETSLAHRTPTAGPLAPVTSHRVSQLSAKSNLMPQSPHPHSSLRGRKAPKRTLQLKPHLISNLNGGKESKSVNGMFYNPDTFCWEGNENALSAFEQPVSTPSANLGEQRQLGKDMPSTTPRPALITNFSATKGVQVVGGMVFDPQNMCWLKIGTPSNAKSETSDVMEGFDALDDEDVFKDIPDLEDKAGEKEGGHGRVSDIQDDWLVGEEFDVGPEFVRRQREEEERWRRKCEKWVGRGARDRDTWRWTIRDLVSQFGDLPV